MYSTDLAVTLRSHCCLTLLHSALFCIPQTLLSHNCTSKLNSTELSLFIHYTDKALTVNIYYWAFKVHSAVFLLIVLILKAFFRMQARFCSSCAFYRPCSHSQQSLLYIKVQFCSFHAFHRPASLTANGHYCA